MDNHAAASQSRDDDDNQDRDQQSTDHKRDPIHPARDRGGYRFRLRFSIGHRCLRCHISDISYTCQPKPCTCISHGETFTVYKDKVTFQPAANRWIGESLACLLEASRSTADYSQNHTISVPWRSEQLQKSKVGFSRETIRNLLTSQHCNIGAYFKGCWQRVVHLAD